MPGLWGDLGKAPGIGALWSEFNARTREAQQFGWRAFGVGGHWDLEPYYVSYWSGEPNPPVRDNPAGFPDAVAMMQVGSIFKEVEGGPSCTDAITGAQFLQRYLFPQWFFDWGKAYLHELRKNQPDFNASPEQKLIWSTHVAWTINMMLGATNLHGAVLSMALYVEATGDMSKLSEGNGSFMYPSLHTKALPSYYQQAIDEAAKKLLNQGVPSDAVLSYGGELYETNAAPVGQSLWLGAPWKTPFETRRLRWVTPMHMGEDCPYSGTCTPKIVDIQGTQFGGGFVSDPHWPLNELGVPARDPSAVTNYIRWSYAIPWIMGVQSWGNLQASKWSGTVGSMLETAVRMSTFFAWGRGDQDFWSALDAWKKDPSPRLKRTGSVNGTTRALYSPNSELSFRYYYPAMIDLLNGIDFASLVARGANIWWLFNVGAVETSVAKWSRRPDIDAFDAEGAAIIEEGGDARVPLVAPPGFCEHAKREYDHAVQTQRGISWLINWVRTIIAIIQAVYGQYGALVGATKGWIEHATMDFPDPGNLWKGVVPPTPFAQRMAPYSVYQGPGVEPAYRVQATPDPIGGGNVTGILSQVYTGGNDIGTMIGNVRGAVDEWGKYGGPVVMSQDVLNMLAARNPAAPASPQFPQLPVPGTRDEPVSMPVEGEEPVAAQAPPPPPPSPEKSSNFAWAAGAVAAVGAFAVYRVRRKGR